MRVHLLAVFGSRVFWKRSVLTESRCTEGNLAVFIPKKKKIPFLTLAVCYCCPLFTAAWWHLRRQCWCNLTCNVFNSSFNTLSCPTFSIYRMWWVIEQPVLGEPWRVLSFCHLHDKLPRQWTWRAGALIQFQLLTRGIRLHAFASLEKGEFPPQKRQEGGKKNDNNLNTVKRNES